MSAFPDAGYNTCDIDTAHAENAVSDVQGAVDVQNVARGTRLIFPARVATLKGSSGTDVSPFVNNKFLYSAFTADIDAAKQMYPPWGGKNQQLVFRDGLFQIEGVHYDSTFDKGYSNSTMTPRNASGSGLKTMAAAATVSVHAHTISLTSGTIGWLTPRM